MLSIVRTFYFEAAHYLPNHAGKCKQLHGHSYHLDVEVTGPLCEESNSERFGMIVDFHELDSFVNEAVLKRVDHTLLNDTLNTYPTAERMVCSIADLLKEAIAKHRGSAIGNLELVRLTLWETRDSCAVWTR